MNLPELLLALRAASKDSVVVDLGDQIERWRLNNDTTDELRHTVERFIGYSWIASANEHSAVYALWSSFRDENIDRRTEMPVNARLDAFDLLGRYNTAKTDDERLTVLRKIDPESVNSA